MKHRNERKRNEEASMKKLKASVKIEKISKAEIGRRKKAANISAMSAKKLKWPSKDS